MLESKLNKLLANYAVEYHKLQTLHWYVKDHAFFQAHAKLEDYYNEAYEAVDEIAEKLRMIGGKPLANLDEFKANATISEAKGEFVTLKQAFATAKADFEQLLADVKDIKHDADEEDNYLISAFADDLIETLSKDIWMLGQSED